MVTHNCSKFFYVICYFKHPQHLFLTCTILYLQLSNTLTSHKIAKFYGIISHLVDISAYCIRTSYRASQLFVLPWIGATPLLNEWPTITGSGNEGSTHPITWSLLHRKELLAIKQNCLELISTQEGKPENLSLVDRLLKKDSNKYFNTK